MIQFDDISKAYGGETLLEGLTFTLSRGERCGLVGRNGSGKSTLLRLITKEEFPDGGTIECPKGYTIGYLTQHLHLTRPTLLEEAAQELPPEHSFKVEKILFGLGFKEEDLQKDPQSFSGGYQLRIHLAKVLAKEPDCLLLDEPTNYLDIVSIRWITRFLKNWPGELILISHDRDFMDQVTTHTLGIHRKKIKKLAGGTQKFYEQLLQEEEIHEKTRLNLEKKRAHVESFIERFGGKATKATQAESRKKMLSRMPVLEKLAQLHHLDFAFPYAPFAGKRLLEVSNCAFTYPGMGEMLIPNFSLSIDKGERIAIIGKNGRGKSTLLRLLAQDLEPKKGEITVSANTKIGFFGQSNIERLDPEKTIEEEIASASKELSIGQVRNICGIMLFSGDLAKKPIRVLSGGEKSRVLLGKILASPCNLLLLDEPTNHLDMESIEALIGAIEHFEGAVVLVSHSELLLRAIPDHFVICHQGNQHLFHGDYDLFLEKEGWEEEEIKTIKTKIIPNRKEQLQQLKKFERQIDRVEKEILTLEVAVEKECEQLILASQHGNREEIGVLSKEIDIKKKKIDNLFNELEILTIDYEKNSKMIK